MHHNLKTNRCKPVHRSSWGILDLQEDSLLVLRKAGTELVVTSGGVVRAFALTDHSNDVSIKDLWTERVRGKVIGLLNLSGNVLVAFEQTDCGTAILRIQDERYHCVEKITDVPGKLTSCTGASKEVLFATQPLPKSIEGKLYRLDTATGMIRMTRDLPGADVDLQLDPTTNRLTITHRLYSTVVTIPADLLTWPSEVVSRYQPRTNVGLCKIERSNDKFTSCLSKGRCCSEPKCCSCAGKCSGNGHGCGNTTTGGSSTGGMSNGSSGSLGSGSSNPVISSPGTSGAPISGGGTIIGGNGGVSQVPSGGDWGPIGCTVDLLWNPASLKTSRDILLAMDKQRRNVTLLQLQPFSILQEYQNRAGFLSAIDAEVPKVLLFTIDARREEATKSSHAHIRKLQASNISLLHFAGLDPQDNLKHLQPIFPIPKPDVKVFIGQPPTLHVESLMPGAAPLGPINVMIFPIIEPGQIFSSPDMTSWARWIQRILVEPVVQYYKENSFDQMGVISFYVYGRDMAVGGPLQVPKALSDYYFPDYSPAGLKLTKIFAPSERMQFDGRDHLDLVAMPDNNIAPSTTLSLDFPAAIFERSEQFYPVQIKFTTGDKLIMNFDDGTSFTATLISDENIVLKQDATLDATKADLGIFLQNALNSAGGPQFTNPVLRIVPDATNPFGTLIVTLDLADTAGARLGIVSIDYVPTSATVPFSKIIGGSISPGNTADLSDYLTDILKNANIDKGHDTETSLTQTPIDVPTFDPSTNTLTATLSVGPSIGGPSASLSVLGTETLDVLYQNVTPISNSDTNFNHRKSVRDAGGLFTDILNLVEDRSFVNPFKEYNIHVMLAIPLGPPPIATNPVDTNPPLPNEAWAINRGINRPFDFRGFESFNTISTSDGSIQFQKVWSLVFLNPDGTPDIPMTCHELGHGIGFRDLYKQEGYRETLAYFEGWAMMSDHTFGSHHCGYHKWQAGWIPDERVLSIPMVGTGVTSTQEALLSTVDEWYDGLEAQAIAQFGLDSSVAPFTQLVKLDLGGDEVLFDLIEARQPGTVFSRHLPPPGKGILISNAYVPWDDTRYADDAFSEGYRREAQLLNPNNVLTSKGDSFDFANAQGYPSPSIKLDVLDVQNVRGVDVYHIKVTRTESKPVDLYFEQGNPKYRSPDIYIDWHPNIDANDNNFRQYPHGQPIDQGAALEIPKTKDQTEVNYVVARIHNRGPVSALAVKLDFSVCDPGGAGDGGTFQPIGSTVIDEVPPGNQDTYSAFHWPVPGGAHSDHICVRVQIADYTIPSDAGAASADAETNFADNWAQKNVTVFVPASASPYDPVEWDYSVNNAGPRPETAYLEPENLPYGMTLTVSPSRAVIPPRSTKIFKCSLQLDDTIIDTGCRSDRQFRLNAWRQDRESSSRWGGVQYKVLPRKKCTVTLSPTWYSSASPVVTGTVVPNPGGGRARVWIEFDAGAAAFWTYETLDDFGGFVWKADPPDGARELQAYAVFEGNAVYESAASDMVDVRKQIIF